jgi:glycosyltransferase involved in cell wall biosynthesis
VTQSGSVRVVIASNFPRDEKLGTSRTPLRLATELAGLGIDVSLIFAEDLTAVPTGRTDQLTAPFRMALALASSAREADVVDIAGFDGWPYAHFARRWRPGQAIVSRSNGLWFKALAVEGRLEAGTARGLASHLYQRLVLRRWEQSSICQSDLALFLSHDDRGEILRRGWKSSEGLAVVNPAADEFFASPIPLEQRRNVAFVGTFFHRKGSDVVGKSMSRILRDRPGLSLTLFGTGLAADDVLAAFDPLVRPRVIVVEPLSPRELARRLGQFAVLLFPTRYEGFGIVVIEAMRAGLAVVTTPTGAGTDLIHDGENGLLIPIGSVESAERAVAALVDNPELRIRLANAAIADTRERSWERAARETQAVYERARALAARRAFGRPGAA